MIRTRKTIIAYQGAQKALVRVNGSTPLRKHLGLWPRKSGGAVVVEKEHRLTKRPVMPVGDVNGHRKVLLSVDPGLAEIGYAIFKGPKYIKRYGMIITSPRKPITYRLKYIHYKLRQLIKKYHCEHVVLEDFYGSPSMRNRGAVIAVAKAHGATQVLPRAITLVSTVTTQKRQKVRDRKRRKILAIRKVKELYGIPLKFSEHHVADAILQGRWFYEKRPKLY